MLLMRWRTPPVPPEPASTQPPKATSARGSRSFSSSASGRYLSEAESSDTAASIGTSGCDPRLKKQRPPSDLTSQDQRGHDVQQARCRVEGAYARRAPGHDPGHKWHEQAEDNAHPEEQRIIPEQVLGAVRIGAG